MIQAHTLSTIVLCSIPVCILVAIIIDIYHNNKNQNK
jgi:hypothetical protein